MQACTSSATQPSDDFAVVPAAHAAHLPVHPSPRFRFKVPTRWMSGDLHNPYAAAAAPEILAWLRSLGCSEAEVQRAARFDAAGYVGIPFPRLTAEQTLTTGKYLSLWLLWDDVHVESLENRWRIDAAHVLSGQRPPAMTRFDEGWWQLLSGFAATRSPRWLTELCRSMRVWNDAAVQEAVAVQRYRDRGIYPAFAWQLDTRIATIGMYATIYLLEDTYGHELGPTFHALPPVRRMKLLANKIVGIGNDILSFGKDFVEQQPNLIATLMHEERLAGPDAVAHLIRMHDEALLEFDALADDLGSHLGDHAAASDPLVARWIQDVRYASLGFSLWEAQSPRYTAHTIVADGMVLAPGFTCVDAAE